MIKDIAIPWLDVGFKYFVLMYSTYYFFMRCACEKVQVKKMAAAAFFSAVMGISLIRIRPLINPFHPTLMLVYISLTNCLLYRNETEAAKSSESKLKMIDIVVVSLLSFTFCHALFMIVGFVSSTFLSLTYYYFFPENCNSVWDFLNDFKVHTITYFIMLFLVWLMTYLATRIMRLRSGIMNIVSHGTGGTWIMIALMMHTLLVAFGSIGYYNKSSNISVILLAPAMISCAVMIYWAKFEVKSDYIIQLRERNMIFMKDSISKKDRTIADLERDNESLAGIIRRDDELLRLLIDNLSSGANNAETARVAESVEKLYSGRCEAIERLESHGLSVEKTGVPSLDGVLFNMACIAENKGVDFSVSVNTDMKQYYEQVINQMECNTIVADLVQNAIIAAGSRENRRVAVRIASNEEHFSLEVFDSGENFDINILRNMGRQQITTHAGEGGSGIGLMTLFKILKYTGASFIIEEFANAQSHDNYTKRLNVIFDGEGKYRIITDRYEEIKAAMKSGRFEIVKC